MDVIAFVQDLQRRVHALEKFVICAHRHTLRRDAIARHWRTVRIAAGVVTVCYAAYHSILGWIAVCASHGLAAGASVAVKTRHWRCRQRLPVRVPIRSGHSLAVDRRRFHLV